MRGIYLLVFEFFLVFNLTGCGFKDETTAEIKAKAQSFREKGEIKASIIEYKNAIQLAPDQAELRFSLGEVYSEIGDFTSAAKEFERAVKLDPNNSFMRINLAQVYMALMKYEEVVENLNPDIGDTNVEKAQVHAFLGLAKAYLGHQDALGFMQKAKFFDPDNVEVRLAWASYERIRGNDTQRRAWLVPLVKGRVGNPDAWSQLGEIEHKAKNFQAAIGAYTNSIRLRKYHHPDQMQRAIIYIEMNALDKAQADIDELLKAKVSWVGPTHIAGIIAIKTQNWTKAREYFQKVLALRQDYIPSQYFLAIIEARENNLQNALSLLEQYIDRVPDNTRANLLYVEILIRLNKLDKAQNSLRRLYNTNQSDPRILVLFGRTFLKQNKVDRAIEYFKKSIDIEPDDVIARELLGNALLSQSETRSLGRAELEKALQLDPMRAKVYASLFNSYLDEKDYERAKGVANRVEKWLPATSQSVTMTALISLRQGKPEVAIGMLEEALNKFPRDEAITDNLAKLYLSRQDYSSARKLFNDSLLNDPSNMKALLQLALIAKREGDDEQAMHWLEQAVEKNPEQITPKLALAAEFVVSGKPEKADSILGTEEVKHGSTFAYRLVRSQAKIALGDYKNARLILESLLEDAPEFVTAQLLLAKVYASTNEKLKLREVLEQILTLDSGNFNALLAITRLELLDGNFVQFKEKMNFLIRDYANHPDVQWLKAKLDSGNRDYRGAVVTLTNLLGKAPNSSIVKELARNQWATGARDEAIASLENWLIKNPADVNVLSDLAEYYVLEKRESDSLRIYNKLNQLAPNNPLVLNNLAWLLRDVDVEKALDHGLKAAKLEPQDSDVMDTLAVLYLKNSQPENAQVYSATAFKLNPGSELIQLHHAKVLLANDERKMGMRILDQLVKKAGSEEIKQEAKLELEKLK
jgi:putative PEP-CTERM system TPR-repeat lipoprotein